MYRIKPSFIAAITIFGVVLLTLPSQFTFGLSLPTSTNIVNKMATSSDNARASTTDFFDKLGVLASSTGLSTSSLLGTSSGLTSDNQLSASSSNPNVSTSSDSSGTTSPAKKMASDIKKQVPRIEDENKPEMKGPQLLPIIHPTKPKKGQYIPFSPSLLQPLNTSTSVTTSPGVIQQSPNQTPQSAAPLIASPSATTLGPNLIQNPSLETTGSNGLPANWFKGGYGTNNRVLAYPVSPASDGSKAAKVTITSYTSGDAKWYFKEVPVNAGSQYQFSDYSLSNVSTILTAQFRKSDGTLSYQNIGTVGASSNFQKTTVTFTVPSNVVSLTIFHLLKSAGSLTVDQYSLNEITTSPQPPPPPPPSGGNLVQNGDFETADSNGLPVNWLQGAWGTSNRSFSYPVTGVDGSKAARVDITSYSSGDVKWYFKPINLAPGLYTYQDQYISNTGSYITIQYQNSNGSYTYQDLAIVTPSSNWGALSFDFTVPTGVSNVTIFHLIKSVGYLTIDNVSVTPKTAAGVFSGGAVTLRFDDGWASQYQYALPKLKNAGLKGTFYIVTEQLADNGYPGFMSKAQIADLYNAGNEIGAHTRTHADLPTLSSTDQQTEISGSRQDLLSWNVGPILSFAYPYGDYNSTTIQLVQDAGFTSAAATLDGNVTPTSDPYQLQRQGVTVNVTASQAEQWIDSAVANKQWLILAFHAIDYSGTQYSTTPETFNAIVDYLVAHNVPVVTVSQGVQSL